MLTLKVRAGFTNAVRMSDMPRADAGLPFSRRISSPDLRPAEGGREGERETEGERQREKQTERERERERQTEKEIHFI